MLRVLVLFFISFNLYAAIVLDVEITHEKGLDEKMILKSELMSKEIVQSGREIVLQMKNGIKMKLKANFDLESDEFGPSSEFNVEAVVTIFNVDRKFNIETKVNESSEVFFESGEGQRTTIIITPKLN